MLHSPVELTMPSFVINAVCCIHRLNSPSLTAGGEISYTANVLMNQLCHCLHKAGASGAPAFVIALYSKTINPERCHIHRGLFAIHHLGEQFAGGRAEGKALMAVAEGEP